MSRSAGSVVAILLATGIFRTVAVYLSALLLALLAGRLAAEPVDSLSPDVIRFIVANTEFSVMHEMGHMLIAEYDLPVLGREEDAADQLGFIALFQLYSRLSTAEVDARLLDIADYWRLEWQRPKSIREQVQAWDTHPLDEQRYYNIVCLLYGSDMRRLDWVPELTHLPYERALYCDDEFRQARRALHWVGSFQHKAIQRRAGIRVVFEAPTGAIPDIDQLITPLHDDDTFQRLADDITQLLQPPRALTLRLMSCGAPDASYNRRSGELTLCYERLDHFRHLAETLKRLKKPSDWHCPRPELVKVQAC
ncbi:DUF4344 domain-containing metallopeptidase [Pseudomonas jinjuensis]|uniref:Metallopeptidase n=1 Tax=Pseudomonas jinjuensis TaxID=198616 RepID=A0A1H0HEW9_9PSED|nr:DUF4344 domain-containing metallopeptidase [Pseudomonas jinjuensis]SDO17623.1 Putative metallopeptidase [Pseudomonas jinjuensis]